MRMAFSHKTSATGIFRGINGIITKATAVECLGKDQQNWPWAPEPLSTPDMVTLGRNGTCWDADVAEGMPSQSPQPPTCPRSRESLQGGSKFYIRNQQPTSPASQTSDMCIQAWQSRGETWPWASLHPWRKWHAKHLPWKPLQISSTRISMLLGSWFSTGRKNRLSISFEATFVVAASIPTGGFLPKCWWATVGEKTTMCRRKTIFQGFTVHLHNSSGQSKHVLDLSTAPGFWMNYVQRKIMSNPNLQCLRRVGWFFNS